MDANTNDKSPAHILVSANYIRYEDDNGWLKAVHPNNPRFKELKDCVDAARMNHDAYPADTSDRDWRPSLLSFDDALGHDFIPRGFSLAVFCGGLNGGGDDFKWLRYLDDIRAVVERVVSTYGECWVVSISVHSDVYYVTLGIEDKRRYDVGKQHLRTMYDEMVSWEHFVSLAVASGRPMGIIDWGDRSFDWAWGKISSPYGWPLSAFSGSLFHYMGCYNDLRVFEKLDGTVEADHMFFRAREVKPILDDRMLFFVREADDSTDDDIDKVECDIASGRSAVSVVPLEASVSEAVHCG